MTARGWGLRGLAVAALGFGLIGCGPADPAPAPSSRVVSDDFARSTRECDLLSDREIGAIVGFGVRRGFHGAICRWEGVGDGSVTFNWFEWQTMAGEQTVLKRLGYETENVKIGSYSAIQHRDPQLPGACGVTAKSPAAGTYSWFVHGPGGDSCEAAKRLMMLVLKNSA